MHAKNRARFVCLALGWAALLVGAPRSEADVIYTYTDLGTLPGDGGARPMGINASGDVVGVSESNSGDNHAFLYHDGTMTGLGIQGNANAINDSGVIVGYDSSRGKSFVYDYGVETPLPAGTPLQSSAVGINNNGQVLVSSLSAGSEIINPDGTVKAIANPLVGLPPTASSINNSGQAVGFLNPTPFEPRAYLYSDGVVTDLGAKFGAGGPDRDRGTVAVSINNAGQVLINGLVNPAMNTPVIYDTKTGTITSVPKLVGTFSAEGMAMNNLGQVVGVANTSVAIPFLYSGGALQNLATAFPDFGRWTYLDITGINDSGQIIGFGKDKSGKDHAFLLSPQVKVPEPTTLACWGLAAVGLAMRARGRRGR